MLHRRTPGKLLPVLLGLFLLVGCVHGNRTRGTSDFAGFVSAYAQEHHFSGTVLVAQRGCTLFRGSFGLAERAFAVPAEDSTRYRSEEHTSELQSRQYLVCRLLLEK